MADVEKGKKREEPEEYVPAEYVAADADEQVNGLNGIPPEFRASSGPLTLVHTPFHER